MIVPRALVDPVLGWPKPQATLHRHGASSAPESRKLPERLNVWPDVNVWSAPAFTDGAAFRTVTGARAFVVSSSSRTEVVTSYTPLSAKTWCNSKDLAFRIGASGPP